MGGISWRNEEGELVTVWPVRLADLELLEEKAHLCVVLAELGFEHHSDGSWSKHYWEEPMAELEWIQKRDSQFKYLFAQAFGNMAAIAMQWTLETGDEIDPDWITKKARLLAEAGLVEIEDWRKSQDPPVTGG